MPREHGDVLEDNNLPALERLAVVAHTRPPGHPLRRLVTPHLPLPDRARAVAFAELEAVFDCRRRYAPASDPALVDLLNPVRRARISPRDP